jgi:hypothetical protein
MYNNLNNLRYSISVVRFWSVSAAKMLFVTLLSDFYLKIVIRWENLAVKSKFWFLFIIYINVFFYKQFDDLFFSYKKVELILTPFDTKKNNKMADFGDLKAWRLFFVTYCKLKLIITYVCLSCVKYLGDSFLICLLLK